jgi:hypothetical protein
MKKKTFLSLALLGLLALGGPAFAELCTIDDVPAATLLLPYFEVDLSSPGGPTTLFDVTNASAAAQLVHVVVWSDLSVPVLDFDIYLTGFDVVSINLRDVLNGILPRTAPRSLDAGDAFSPSPPLGATQAAPPWDTDFPNCAGRLPFPPVALNAAQIAHLQASLTGQPSALFGGACAGLDYGDDIARGYVTVDDANECSLEFPGDPGYFAPGGTGIAGNDNVLWGNYYYVDSDNNFAQGETLVHVEADAGIDFGSVNTTFYGRYVLAGEDNREPLPTTWAARYIGGVAFDGGTDLIVWREGGTPTPDGFSCAVGAPAWFPLNQTQVVAFDEEENGEEICIPGGDIVSPPTGEAQTCFPAEAQRVPVNDVTLVPGADSMGVTAENGWIYLNLNWQASIADLEPKQSWVTTVMDAEGRYSVAMDAIQLDSACTTFAPGPVIDAAP